MSDTIRNTATLRPRAHLARTASRIRSAFAGKAIRNALVPARWEERNAPGLQGQELAQPLIDLQEEISGELTVVLEQSVPVDWAGLRYVDYGVVRQTASSPRDYYISGCISETQVGRKWADDDRPNAAFVERITLDDKRRAPVCRGRTAPRTEIDPPDMPAPRLHHRFCSATSEAIASSKTRSSSSISPSAYTAFKRAVTDASPCRCR